jgi:flagellar hook-associated protein 1 FlgK
MSGLGSLLETARRAMLTQQVGINVTGHNIANASTPGYSRQRAEIIATPAIRDKAGFIGTGSMAAGVSRLRNRFIDQQLRTTNGYMGNAATRQQILGQVEATFNEPSDSSIGSALSDFLNAWQDLSTHPEDPVSRTALMQQGGLVSDAFHRVASSISTFRGSLLDEVNAKISRINTVTKEIATLDVQILAAQSNGEMPNDLLDQRDTRIEELSKMANVSVSEDQRGSVTVAIGSMVVASGGGATALKAVGGAPVTYGATSYDQIRIVSDPAGVGVDINAGELGGILETYNTTIPGYLGKLDQTAAALITAVNTAHSAGYGNQSPPLTGINFFRGTSAATIGIDLTDTSGGAAPGSNPAITNIAASSGPPAAAGNNDVALQIAALSRNAIPGLGNVTVSQYYNNLVSDIGIAVNGAANVQSSNELVVAQLENQRDTVSAVSLDEEMANLIKFQRAFDAAARMVNTADEMFQTILNMV